MMNPVNIETFIYTFKFVPRLIKIFTRVVFCHNVNETPKFVLYRTRRTIYS